jgi:hypothetical protein
VKIPQLAGTVKHSQQTDYGWVGDHALDVPLTPSIRRGDDAQFAPVIPAQAGIHGSHMMSRDLAAALLDRRVAGGASRFALGATHRILRRANPRKGFDMARRPWYNRLRQMGEPSLGSVALFRGTSRLSALSPEGETCAGTPHETASGGRPAEAAS